VQLSALDRFPHEFAREHPALMSAVPEIPNLRVIERTSFKRPVLCERADDIERDLRTNAFLADAAVFKADVLNPANPQSFVAHRCSGDEIELLNSTAV
jgi:hypothetical protein